MPGRVQKRIGLCVTVAPLLIANQPAAAVVRHVNAHAPFRMGTGLSWMQAHRHLQDALAAAMPGDEIWVAQGIYKPDMGFGFVRGDRGAGFALQSGVRWLGGFAGNESRADQRNPLLHEVILSGEIGDESLKSDNSFHVVHLACTNPGAPGWVDGFTIQNGWSDHRGGGIEGTGAFARIHNCKIRLNIAEGYGGGLAAEGCEIEVVSCEFVSNFARTKGGGAWVSDGCHFKDCTFNSNSTVDEGGGIHCGYGTVIDKSAIGRNHASVGGGVYATDAFTISDSTLVENGASERGGGLHATSLRESIVVQGCKFIRNTCESQGGGAYVSPASKCLFDRCSFLANNAIEAGATLDAGNTTYANCLLYNNAAWLNAGGIRKTVAAASIINCTLVQNHAAFASAGVHADTDVEIANSILWQNDLGGVVTETAQLLVNGIAVLNYSCMQAFSGSPPGQFNTASDPLFTNPLMGDFHLRAGSPCVAAGSNDVVPVNLLMDLDGNPRIAQGQVDIGCYEGRVP